MYISRGSTVGETMISDFLMREVVQRRNQYLSNIDLVDLMGLGK